MTGIILHDIIIKKDTKTHIRELMITLFESFLSQIEILAIGLLLFTLKHIISGDERAMLDALPDSFRRDLKNKYYQTFFIVLWFGFFTWLGYYIQKPRYGIWSYLFAYDNKLFWLILFLTIVTRVGMWLYDRFYPTD